MGTKNTTLFLVVLGILMSGMFVNGAVGNSKLGRYSQQEECVRRAMYTRYACVNQGTSYAKQVYFSNIERCVLLYGLDSPEFKQCSKKVYENYQWRKNFRKDICNKKYSIDLQKC